MQTLDESFVYLRATLSSQGKSIYQHNFSFNKSFFEVVASHANIFVKIGCTIKLFFVFTKEAKISNVFC